MGLPQRKPLRLEGYDYSLNGLYFITICAFNRQNIFSEITDVSLETSCKLTKYGEILDSCINSVSEWRPAVQITDYVIMPNHLHMIVWVSDINAETCVSKRSLISNTVGYIKMQVSKKIHEISPMQSVWQRNYHDHIIRNHEEYNKIVRYIAENPKRWQYDVLYCK